MAQSTAFDPEHSLWYRREANRWEEALPHRQRPYRRDGVRRASHANASPSTRTHCGLATPSAATIQTRQKPSAPARALTLRGEYHKAQEIIEQKLQGAETQFYLPLGDITDRF